MRRGETLHLPRPRVPAATRQAPPFLPSERQVSPVGSGAVGGGGRTPWRSAHLLSLNAGEAGEGHPVTSPPPPGFADTKTGLFCSLLRASWFTFASFIRGP